jgi:hypothetical protein
LSVDNLRILIRHPISKSTNYIISDIWHIMCKRWVLTSMSGFRQYFFIWLSNTLRKPSYVFFSDFPQIELMPFNSMLNVIFSTRQTKGTLDGCRFHFSLCKIYTLIIFSLIIILDVRDETHRHLAGVGKRSSPFHVTSVSPLIYNGRETMTVVVMEMQLTCRNIPSIMKDLIYLRYFQCALVGQPTEYFFNIHAIDVDWYSNERNDTQVSQPIPLWLKMRMLK